MTLANLLVLLVQRDGDSRRRETIWLKEDSISDTISLFPSVISVKGGKQAPLVQSINNFFFLQAPHEEISPEDTES
jgi:hypothetical protein